MKKLIILSALVTLAACEAGPVSTSQAASDCSNLGYKMGTREYNRCVDDMATVNASANKAKAIAE